MEEDSSVTLLVFGLNECTSSLYVGERSGLVAVGSANGAVRLVFPALDRDSGGSGQPGDGETAVPVRGSSRKFEFICLRSRSSEGIRSIYIDEDSGRLVATAGDSNVFVWDLTDLTPIGTSEPQGSHVVSQDAQCDLYAFDRTHTLGSCNNAFILQHERTVTLIVRNSVTMYTLKFPQGAWPSLEKRQAQLNNGITAHASAKTSSKTSDNKEDGASVDRLGELGTGTNSPKLASAARGSSLDQRVAPTHEESNVTTPINCVPCHFNGRHMVLLKQNDPGVFLLQIRDWDTEDKALVREIVSKRTAFNWLTPTCIQCLDDFVMAVVHFNTVRLWSIHTGKELYSLKGHGHLSRIVCAKLCWPRPADPDLHKADKLQDGDESRVPYVVSIATDKRVFVWRNGRAVQNLPLPKGKANFALGVPYFMEPRFAQSDDGEWRLVELYFNDDTGVHVAWY